MAPIIEEKIPLSIRNSFSGYGKGTLISSKSAAKGSPAKGFASIEKVALVNVEGSGMLGVPGISERLFGSMKDAGVSVIMISQASSEHSICFVIYEKDVCVAKQDRRSN